MDKDEKMKLDYEQTVSIFHFPAEIRFKLLAMIPTFTVARNNGVFIPDKFWRNLNNKDLTPSSSAES